jgi:aminopeptidase N
VRLLLTISGLFLFLACSTPRQVPAPSVTSDEETIVKTIGYDPDYRAAYDQPVDLLHTQLELKPNWEDHYMYGKATITLKPHFNPIDRFSLDARGMDIRSVMLENKNGKKDTADYRYGDDKLTVLLKDKVGRNDSIIIIIEYVAKPDELEQGGGQAIQGDKGLYFINADGKDPYKPRQLWTQGETESNSAWFPTIESTSQKMTQDIFLTVDSSLVTLSNGLLVNVKSNNDGTRTDHWKQSLPCSPYLTMIAVGTFAITKDSWRGKEVSYYVDPPYAPYARRIFGETPAMIEFFSQKLGVDYPWEKYAQIVVHDYVSGAMENTTAVVHGTNMQQDPREMLDENYTDYISHELFHHWFGDLVTCESWSNITLNEGFANYSEYLWREHRYGRENADRHFQGDMGGYLTSSKEDDPPLIRFHYESPDDVFDAVSYNKGGRILHMLRKEIGDDAFFYTLKNYLNTHAYGSAEVHDLRMAFEKTTGQDLNWFFNQWFLEGGHPSITISYRWEDSLKKTMVIIEQTQDLKNNPLYRLPLTVDIYEGEKVRHEKIVVDQPIQSFGFTCESKPLLVNVDAEKMLLCTKKDVHSREEWRFQYTHAPLYLDRWEAIAVIAKDYKANSPDMELMKSALHDRSPKIRSHVIENCGTLAKKDSAATLSALITIAHTDSAASVRKAALKSLKKHYEYPAIAATVNDCINDSSYEVVAAAFDILADNDSLLAIKIAGKLEADSSGIILGTLAEYYAKDTLHDHNTFFIRAIHTAKGWNRYGVIRSYGSYLKYQDGEILDSGINELLAYNERTKRRFAKSSGIAALRGIKNSLETRPDTEENKSRLQKIEPVLKEFDKEESEQ